MHSITYFCSPHLSSFCPDDGTCIGTETLVFKVFSTSEEFLKQEMDHIVVCVQTSVVRLLSLSLIYYS